MDKVIFDSVNKLKRTLKEYDSVVLTKWTELVMEPTEHGIDRHKNVRKLKDVTSEVHDLLELLEEKYGD